MGIFIYLTVSKSITKDEWGRVYQEARELAEAFPLAERRVVSVRGIPTMCLARTQEREVTWGLRRKETETGWFACGDYETLRTAEDYFLPRDLVSDGQREADTSDPILDMVPEYLNGYSWDDEALCPCYHLWGAKTQGEPYHLYLLAVACLIESRLGRKALVHGDITKGQCERAVSMANGVLKREIHAPDRCDKDRLRVRIDELPLTEVEKLQLFVGLYLGRQDADFGAFLRTGYTEQACDEYWAGRFQGYRITSMGFDSALKDYLLWGFALERLCAFVCFRDEEGNEHYDDFVKKIMDAKLHQQNKDCTDMLEIDPDDDALYGVSTLFAQIALRGARNKKVDRYIPIEEIRAALVDAIGDRCTVDELINDYLQKERDQNPPELSTESTADDVQKAVDIDPSYALTEVMKSRMQELEEMDEEYDISRSEDLPYFEVGDTLRPGLKDAVSESYAFYQGVLDEDKYRQLMTLSPEERCQWLAATNRCMLLRDRDWDKIYADIMDHPESFGRYYPMVRVMINSEEVASMVRAFVTNDALYSFAAELDAAKKGEPR